jgi:hypothetical protein
MYLKSKTSQRVSMKFSIGASTLEAICSYLTKVTETLREFQLEYIFFHKSLSE